MKKLILISTFAIILCGCNTMPPKVPLEHQVVKETEYVIRIPPKELMTLPPAVAPMNVDTAKQSDVASWLLSKEEYTRALENQLKNIAKFFVTEQSKLDQAATTQNIQLKEAADAAQAAEQANADKKKVVTGPR